MLALLLGMVNAFDMPIRQSFVVEMVGRDDIANAVALNSAVFNVTRIVGPAIAGLIIATIGIAPLFFLNAVSYLAVIVGLLLMAYARAAPTNGAGRGRAQRSLRGRPAGRGPALRRASHALILIAICVLGVVSTFALNFQVLIPVLARDVLHGNADTYGFLMAASGVGSLVSALAIAFVSGRRCGCCWPAQLRSAWLCSALSLAALAAGRPRAHVRRRLGVHRHGGDDQHDHPAVDARRPARPRDERLHDRLRRLDAVRRPVLWLPGGGLRRPGGAGSRWSNRSADGYRCMDLVAPAGAGGGNGLGQNEAHGAGRGAPNSPPWACRR